MSLSLILETRQAVSAAIRKQEDANEILDLMRVVLDILLAENEVTLPLHTRLTNKDVEYVIGNFVDIVAEQN